MMWMATVEKELHICFSGDSGSPDENKSTGGSSDLSLKHLGVEGCSSYPESENCDLAPKLASILVVTEDILDFLREGGWLPLGFIFVASI